MTRINVIPVCELSDQHLIGEYRELPRVLKQNINTINAPEKYCLGKGHVKWAKRYSLFTRARYGELCREMLWRGFNVNYYTDTFDTSLHKHFYNPTPEDIELNRQRIREKYNLKPNWYRWTKRTKPEWLND